MHQFTNKACLHKVNFQLNINHLTDTITLPWICVWRLPCKMIMYCMSPHDRWKPMNLPNSLIGQPRLSVTHQSFKKSGHLSRCAFRSSKFTWLHFLMFIKFLPPIKGFEELFLKDKGHRLLRVPLNKLWIDLGYIVKLDLNCSLLGCKG